MEKITEYTDGSRQIHTFDPMGEDDRPQDPSMNGEGLTFETLEHGGEYPDLMPQAIKLTDADGKSCIYLPVTEDGQVVQSRGFNFILADRKVA